MVARYAKTPPETNPAALEITYPARGRPVVRAMSNIATTARAGTATAKVPCRIVRVVSRSASW
jgi:hypothetical protein